ncbi:MAG: protein kinase, partial [Planctomycetes bacterium]|nr:protein kinase [Planctomycetota bacterium]
MIDLSQARELFWAALDIESPVDRAEFLDRECQDSAELRSKIDALLAAHKDAGSFLDPVDDEDSDFLSLPAYQTRQIRNDDTVSFSSSLTLDDFVRTVIASGVMIEDEISTSQEHLSSDEKPTTAAELACVLLKQKKLTQYQAKVLCEGKSEGLVLGDYVILDKIGAGGMGQVFKARHRRMKRVVALKKLPELLVDSASAVQRFQREVEAAAKLEHPNVVTAYDAGEANGVHFLVMQFVDGRNLS